MGGKLGRPDTATDLRLLYRLSNLSFNVRTLRQLNCLAVVLYVGSLDIDVRALIRESGVSVSADDDVPVHALTQDCPDPTDILKYPGIGWPPSWNRMATFKH